MFYHNINPVILGLGPFEIRYYGLIYVIGFVAAYFLIKHLAKQRKLGLKSEDVEGLLLYIAVGAILFARLFHILFYDFAYYFNSPLQMLAVWKGGLSFHGGLVGALLAGSLFIKRKKLNFYDLADITVIPLALALFLGRLGNFINGELYGRITTLPWAVKFQGAEGFRHPTQIYESLKNLLIFSALWLIKDKNLPKGFVFWSFVAMYGTLRFFIEFLKDVGPFFDLGFITLTMGQLLCLPMIVAGFYMLAGIKKQEPG